MQENRNDGSTVYVILRIFKIEGSVGMRIYVDPAELKDSGALLFTAETWSVVPAAS